MIHMARIICAVTVRMETDMYILLAVLALLVVCILILIAREFLYARAIRKQNAVGLILECDKRRSYKRYTQSGRWV